MKNLLLLSILLCGLVACNQNPSSANAENTPADAEPTDNLGSQDHQTSSPLTMSSMDFMLGTMNFKKMKHGISTSRMTKGST
jgi:hypothetical protein